MILQSQRAMNTGDFFNSASRQCVLQLLRSAKKGTELQNMKMLKDRLQPDDIQGIYV